MAMTKNEIASELESAGLGRRRQIAGILDGLMELAADEIANGEDFTIPGIVSLKYSYTPAEKKGSRYKKGETYVGFGGVEQVAETDSKPRKARIRLQARPVGSVGKLKPGTKPEAQSAFLRSKAGKYVISRKNSS